MSTVTVVLEGTSTYSQGRHYSKDEVPMLDQELGEAYERRTWRHRMHVDKDGIVFIPPMCFQKTLALAASRLGQRIPGKGQRTYAKCFQAGVMVTDPVSLGIKVADVPGEELFVPSDGKAGGSKRVTKIFGKIETWTAQVTYHVLDETLTEPVFRSTLDYAGNLVGIGRFRPERGGYYGRFVVKSLKWVR